MCLSREIKQEAFGEHCRFLTKRRKAEIQGVLGRFSYNSRLGHHTLKKLHIQV